MEAQTIITIIWVIGVVIGIVLTAWLIGKDEAECSYRYDTDLSMFYGILGVFVSIFWPFAIVFGCIIYSLFWLKKYSVKYHTKKLKKKEIN